MTEFPANPARLDPYKSFKFRVKWDGKYIAGVSRVSALRRTSEVVEYREGGDPSTPHKALGSTKFEPITLERGLTQDRAFEDWANLAWRLGAAAGAEVGLADLRKNIAIELHNEAGQVVLAYIVYRCWPSEYQALPALDAHADAVAIETVTLQNEGWMRDPSVTEPPEPK